MKERKIIKSFRIEPSIWKDFKKKSRAPSYVIREFIKWYLENGEIWFSIKHVLTYASSCMLCRKRIESDGKEALEKGFSRLIIIRANPLSLDKYDVKTFWLCKECSKKLQNILETI